MKTFKRVCKEGLKLKDKDGRVFELEEGKEYITSPVDGDGEVMVFSEYWVRIPVVHFGKPRMFTKQERRKNEDWATAIASRIADEWSGRKDWPEDAKLMEEVLTKLLTLHPEECQKLIGTGIIEGDYFIDMGV